ncbi:hypothetical protein MPF19_11545 [Polaribacter sp. Z014]|uniref:hypothetical protein n=1 Tax=Polaribacter sp. Z014 TaxID=2927126 RepID=UPI0020218279|nr:hypothetical protein [Polaribacter sp. Z014]MCL7764054.1 hypothetical protein [Polaribacter sp. Z014]
MKEENIKNILEKYKSGKSTLKEETFLFDNVDDSETGIKAWSSFVKKNKKVVPDNFNDDSWQSFDKKTTKNNRFKIGLMSAIASILLLSTLYLNNLRNQGLSNNEKEALLNEAKKMFIVAEQTKPILRIIVESDLLIVYTKIE